MHLVEVYESSFPLSLRLDSLPSCVMFGFFAYSRVFSPRGTSAVYLLLNVAEVCNFSIILAIFYSCTVDSTYLIGA